MADQELGSGDAGGTLDYFDGWWVEGGLAGGDHRAAGASVPALADEDDASQCGDRSAGIEAVERGVVGWRIGARRAGPHAPKGEHGRIDDRNEPGPLPFLVRGGVLPFGGLHGRGRGAPPLRLMNGFGFARHVVHQQILAKGVGGGEVGFAATHLGDLLDELHQAVVGG